VLLLLLAAAPSFVGPQVCRSCHPAEFTTQSVSHHAAALRPAADTSLAAYLSAQPLRERSGIEYSYAPARGGVEVSIDRGSARVDALLEWAFGAGVQAITPVGRYRDRFFEHRISWYAAPGQAARTIGHAAEPSATPERALGIVQDAATITRCFACHATGVKTGPDLRDMLPGVTCERCHGPGAAHAARPTLGNIVRLSESGAAASVQLCAECHRGPTNPSPAATPELDDPVSIRFQPVGLMASKCFRVSGALSCVTCHNPHENLIRDSGYYAARCLGCHSATGGRPPTLCERATRQDCLPCHMKRASPLPFLTFTDHRIR
jgi:Cytochrome c554 and c-prime